jgi:hypothetical protein
MGLKNVLFHVLRIFYELHGKQLRFSVGYFEFLSKGSFVWLSGV